MVKFIDTDIKSEDLLEKLEKKGCRFLLSDKKELVVYGKLTDEEKMLVELLELELKKIIAKRPELP